MMLIPKNDAYTEKVNKTALSSTDDKRLQTYDRTTHMERERCVKGEMINNKRFIL